MAKPDWMGQNFKKPSACPPGPSGKMPGYANGGMVRGKPCYADGGPVGDDGMVGQAQRNYLKRMDDEIDAAVKGRSAPDTSAPTVTDHRPEKRELNLFQRAKKALGFADGGHIDFSDPMYADNSAGAFGPMSAYAQEREAKQRQAEAAPPSEASGPIRAADPAPAPASTPPKQMPDETLTSSDISTSTPAPKAQTRAMAKKVVDYGDESARMAKRSPAPAASRAKASDAASPEVPKARDPLDYGDEAPRMRKRNPKKRKDMSRAEKFASRSYDPLADFRND